MVSADLSLGGEDQMHCVHENSLYIQKCYENNSAEGC
jgi:hypothetical protein